MLIVPDKTENGFRDEYFFLSNFYSSPVKVSYKNENFIFNTGEHVFQSMKVAATLNPTDNIKLLRKLEEAPTPGKAKYWGRSIKIDINKWDAISLKCMRRSLQLKFGQHENLKQDLINTGTIELIEYNDWNDQIWGVDQKTGIGKNQLGKTLMELRTKYSTNQP